MQLRYQSCGVVCQSVPLCLCPSVCLSLSFSLSPAFYLSICLFLVIHEYLSFGHLQLTRQYFPFYQFMDCLNKLSLNDVALRGVEKFLKIIYTLNYSNQHINLCVSVDICPPYSLYLSLSIPLCTCVAHSFSRFRALFPSPLSLSLFSSLCLSLSFFCLPSTPSLSPIFISHSSISS